jgi:hypothetical protein
MGIIRPGYSPALSPLKMRRDRVKKVEELIETLIALLDTIQGDPDLEDDDPALCDCHEDLGTAYRHPHLEPNRYRCLITDHDDAEEDDQNVVTNAPLGHSEDDEPGTGKVIRPYHVTAASYLPDPDAVPLLLGHDIKPPKRAQRKAARR